MEASTLLTSLHQRKSAAGRKQQKQQMKKTKPIKVRYISNPMKVETCASKFRELVQELTGQDAADVPPEPAICLTPDAVLPLIQHTLLPAENPVQGILIANDRVRDQPFDGTMDQVPYYLEPLDGDIFVNQMAENSSGYFANGFYN